MKHLNGKRVGITTFGSTQTDWIPGLRRNEGRTGVGSAGKFQNFLGLGGEINQHSRKSVFGNLALLQKQDST